MQQEPIRAFALAQQLNVETRDLLEAARALGIDLRNHLSQVPPDKQAALEDSVRKTVPQLATSAQSISPSEPDAHAVGPDDLDDELFEDDLDEDDEDLDDADDDDEDEDDTKGGYRVDHAEEREYQEDYELEKDDKEPGDFEAEGPEEYGCDD